MREACGLPWLLGFSFSTEKFFLLLTQPLLLFCCIYFLLGWLGVGLLSAVQGTVLEEWGGERSRGALPLPSQVGVRGPLSSTSHAHAPLPFLVWFSPAHSGVHGGSHQHCGLA